MGRAVSSGDDGAGGAVMVAAGVALLGPGPGGRRGLPELVRPPSVVYDPDDHLDAAVAGR